MSASSEWDADVLATDPTETPQTGGVAATVDTLEAGGSTGETEVDALVVEIAETRSEMAGTVEQLGDRLDPSNIADRAKERVREATIGNIEAKVDDMTTAANEFATEAGRTAQEAGSGLVETIKHNPVPAAMAGLGIGWLLMNRRSGQSRTWNGSWAGSGRTGAWDGDVIRGDGASGGDGIAQRAAELPDAIGRRAGDATEAIGDAASGARRAAGDALSTVGQTAGETASNVGRTAADVVSQAQRTVGSNPMAFGAIAVAVGAAVGLALPATDAEKRVMGQAGSQVIDKVETAVSEPLERMETANAR